MVKIESISFLLTMVILHFFISVVDARDVYQLDFDDKTKYKHGNLKVLLDSTFSSGEDSSTASTIRDRVNEQIKASKEREERVIGEVSGPRLVMKTVTIGGVKMKQWVMETP